MKWGEQWNLPEVEVGSKFKMLKSIMQKIPIDCQVIVFSCFSEVLDVCEKVLENAMDNGEMNKREVSRVRGGMTKNKRRKIFAKFLEKETKKGQEKEKEEEEDDDDDDEPKEPKIGNILLILFSVGGIGLNFTGCHYGIFMEPQYNPQVEQQAVARM